MANLAKAARAMTSKASCGRIALAASLTFGLGALNCAEAATITAASASFIDVSTAIASASDGDTVIIPARPASWTSKLIITKGITLQGATSISGDHSTSLAGTPMAANDQTVITNNVPRDSSGNNELIHFNVAAGQTARLTGFTIKEGSTGGGNTAHVVFGGVYPYPTIRVDHCHFVATGDMNRVSDCFGVLDHNIFDVTGGGGHCATVGMGVYGSNSYQQGAGSFADYAHYGSANFVFLEDNTMNNNGSQTADNVDAIPGGRYVLRYNILKNTLSGGGHGLDNGIPPGIRAGEYYKNEIYPTSVCCGSWGGQQRSGSLLSWCNTWHTTNGNYVKGKSLEIYRLVWTYLPWGGATGVNPWDCNDTEGNGTFVAGHSPHLYGSGTHTGANGATVLVDSTKNWTTNQWVKQSNGSFELVNLSNSSAPPGEILSNTSNTITYSLYNDSGGPTTFNSGNSYQIHKVLVPAHSIGRGKGDLVTYPSGNGGSQPQNPRWLNEQLEPCYSWDSYGGSAVGLWSQSGKVLLENRDFYNLNTSWAPGNPLTTGVAVGTLANRPTQSTPGTDISGVTPNPPGVAYWATDDGPANQNGAVSGTLYVCTATNTWTKYYTPYQYPHPLVSGAPSAPQNLRVSGP